MSIKTIDTRKRFRKIPQGIYINAKMGKAIVVKTAGEYYLGHLRIRQGKYKSIVWREGKHIKEAYLGT